jgi:small subunit ribosomal protein S6
MSLQNKRKYKITIILDSRGYEAPVETLEEKVTTLLTELGGEVESIENLGRKDFIRVTDKEHTGDTYLILQVTGAASMPSALQDRVRIDKNIKRALVESA